MIFIEMMLELVMDMEVDKVADEVVNMEVDIEVDWHGEDWNLLMWLWRLVANFFYMDTSVISVTFRNSAKMLKTQYGGALWHTKMMRAPTGLISWPTV